MYKIKVIRPSYNNIGFDRDDSYDFYLEQDHWDDFDYKTLYHLHLSGKYTDDHEPQLIGSVKILRKGQKGLEPIQIKTGEIIELGSEFCSLGQSLDYYSRISRLNEALKDYILKSLNDIIIHSEIREEFEQEEGWNVSLLRDINIKDGLFEFAPVMISNNFDQLVSLNLSFGFFAKGLNRPIEFNFSAPNYGFFNYSLPNRISVLIGQNGTGKSTIISKIARIAFASTNDRLKEDVKKVGEIYPEGLGFPKIINISYSCFDSFQVPGVYKKEKEQIAKEIAKNEGRFLFFGIRDISQELRNQLKDLKVNEDGRLYPSEVEKDRYDSTVLKSLQQLSKEFEDAIEFIQSDNDSQNIFDNVLDIITEEGSMLQYKNKDIKSMTYEFFYKLSTGHKFVFHSIVNTIASISPRTLILFDEPETHLHPPLLAAMMQAYRYILNKVNAFMILTTHSPVVLQETLSSNVHVLRKQGEVLRCDPPKIQTYGENIGIITSEVFGLNTDVTGYHNELDHVISEIQNQNEKENEDLVYDKINKLFGNNLSQQARAYIISKVYKS